MSRIQEAIAKAAQQRQGKETEAVDAVNRVVEPPPPSAPVPDAPIAEAPDLPAESVAPDFPERTFDSPLLVAANDSNPIIREQFRKLKTEILTKTANGSRGNTMLVTSSVAGEGKTLSACNLALSLAHDYDHTVLLIDADLRRPRVHDLFEIDGSVGLSQCLLGEARLEDALQHAGYGKLTLLPAGGTVAEPSEMLSSQRMRHFLKEIKERYPDRYVVIDCSPALLFSDAKSLAAAVDGVLYVVRERTVRASHVQQGLGVLKEAPIWGLIYNGTEAKSVEYGYHSYY